MTYPMITGRKAWQDVTVPTLAGGIDTSKRPDELDQSQSVTAKNVLLQKKSVLSDTGYAAFGSAIVGYPQSTYQFYKRAGTSEEMLVTTATVYKYSSALAKWLLVKGTAATTTTAGYAAGSTVIAVASAAGFATGELVGIALDDGSQLQTTITVSGLNFTLAAAVPVGRSVANGAIVLRAVVLSGDRDNQVVPVTVPSHDWFVFTNGVNIVMRYDGTDCVIIPGIPSNNTICKSVVVYNAALFLLNTIEAGAATPQRVRRSNQADPTDWTTGTAGYDDLLDSADAIHTGVILGPYLIVYRERAISRGQFIGSGGINYSFETMVTGDGAASANAVVDIGDYHIVVGNSNIYEYRGGFELAPIGDQIFYRLFGVSGNSNPQYKSQIFAFYVEELDEAWIFYTDTSNTYPNKLLRYNVGEEKWYERVFAHTFIGYGFYQVDTTRTWASLVGSWLAQIWKWNSTATLKQSPTTHLCSAETDQVYEYDYITTLDAGAAISYTLETKDFTVADSEFRLDLVRLFMRGTNVLVEYSVNAGDSWNTLVTITNSSSSKVDIGKQLVATNIRFRFSGTSPDFKLDWLYFLYKIESFGAMG